MKHPRLALITVLTLSVAGLTGCEYAGPGGGDNPIARNLTWFSYVGGQDIRKQCAPGAPDDYRFVYNGIYKEQIRTYDVRLQRNGQGATVSAWARGQPDLSKPHPLFSVPMLWSGTRGQATMPAAGVKELRSALKEDGFSDFRPVGLRLPSNEFYWTAVACVGGRFELNAWLYPSKRFKNLKFPAVLGKYDHTGVPFYKARPDDQRAEDPTLYEGDGSQNMPFFMQLGRNGFVDSNAPF